jgi:hypothetical protein
MSEAGETHQGFGFGSGPILMGLLGLQLMLLAFFIVLVSMSSFDQKRVHSVLGSIQAQFTGLPRADEGTDEQSRADAVTLDAVRDEVAGVLATALQLDRVERTGIGAVEIEFAAGKLFAADTAQLLPGMETVLRRVVEALDRRPVGYRYELDVLVGRTQNAAADAGLATASLDAASLGAASLETRRAGALVSAFIAAAARPNSMAAGLQPTAPDRVRLVLRLLTGTRPNNLFATLPAATPASPQ